MTLDSSKVRVGVTGAVSQGLTTATAPTGTGSALTGFTDLGYVSEDGVVLTQPDAGDTTPIKAWQNGATVRIIRTLSEDFPSLAFTFLETKLEVIQAYFGVTVSQTLTEGSFTIDTTQSRTYNSYVVDVVDGAELIRIYVPRGIVTSVGDLSFTNGDPVGYQVTIDCERNSTLGYNLKTWMTALKS
ncbi:MAG: hypothetical protein HOQ21_06005 [Dermatophilaceae bacterium]|nr:hypothetical protein [Dermatophilaceae bacterium]